MNQISVLVVLTGLVEPSNLSRPSNDSSTDLVLIRILIPAILQLPHSLPWRVPLLSQGPWVRERLTQHSSNTPTCSLYGRPFRWHLPHVSSILRYAYGQEVHIRFFKAVNMIMLLIPRSRPQAEDWANLYLASKKVGRGALAWYGSQHTETLRLGKGPFKILLDRCFPRVWNHVYWHRVKTLNSVCEVLYVVEF